MASERHILIYMHQAAALLSLSSALTTVYILKYYSKLYSHSLCQQKISIDTMPTWEDAKTNCLLDFVTAKYEASGSSQSFLFGFRPGDFKGAQDVVKG
jgi:hypothetical protein